MKFLLLVLLLSCSTINSRGIMIDVHEELNSKSLDENSKIGEVACLQNYFMVTGNYNRRLCIDNLRNQAAELGGDFLIIDKEVKLPGALSTGRELRATVYKSKKALVEDNQKTLGVDTE